jgi:thiol:disulfide interchange protein
VTCKANEAVALNIRSTKKLFEENGVVALKADKDKMPGVNELLKELGNTATAIPYYAIYSPGWEEPVHFGGNVLTAGKVRTIVEEALQAAGKPAGPRQASLGDGRSGG